MDLNPVIVVRRRRGRGRRQDPDPPAPTPRSRPTSAACGSEARRSTRPATAELHDPTPRPCFHHPDRETGPRVHPLRPARVPRLPDPGVGRFAVLRVRARRPRRRGRNGPGGGSRRLERNPWVTQAIVGGTIVAYLVISLRDTELRRPAAQTSLRPRAVRPGGRTTASGTGSFTNSLVHYGFLHIAFNMFILYQVGHLPRARDRARAVRSSLYVVSVLGGAAGALLLDPHAFTGGASGGVFGLAAAATLVLHRQGVGSGRRLRAR